jgi:hypothetical protein
LKTFLFTKILLASLIGFLISVSSIQPGCQRFAQTKQALSVKSASAFLHNHQVQIDSGIVDDDDGDEPVQQRSVDHHVLVPNFRPFLFVAPCPRETFTSDASHCILIHCLKI